MCRKLYDISEICKLLSVSSRALRFYEEKGIIESIRHSSGRRQYSDVQLERIRNVLVLRKLGISVKNIRELQQQDTDLKTTLSRRRAEIGAMIDTKRKEIQLLDQALARLEHNTALGDMSPPSYSIDCDSSEMLNICTNAIIHGNPAPLYKFLSSTMKEYMPLSVFEKIRQDTLLPLGNFCRIEQLEQDVHSPHVFHHFIRYEHLGLKIRYVILDHEIHGLWLGYYEL